MGLPLAKVIWNAARRGKETDPSEWNGGKGYRGGHGGWGDGVVVMHMREE